ncbi:hypothetical protein [Actinomadura madurae]|uniref:hypothetical protein n=1 Tax=Actinomadura madurae TaxID=1993 RepID=UPI0020D2425E|nr:hypothetical protein [Actinomadura madurae]MCP9983024.1 hypothetical protein [Actinomadura madurae]
MVAILIAGGGRWNAVAVATTLTAIALIGIVAVRLAPPASPVTFSREGPPGVLVADLAGLHRLRVGVRRPGPRLHRRPARARRPRGLRGAPRRPRARGLHRGRRGRGGQRIHRRRRRPGGPDGLPAANLFVAASVIAPTLAAVHSGVFAVRRFLPAPSPAGDGGRGWWGRVDGRQVVAVLAISVPGAVLAALRVDRMLLDWLTVLAAALPALVPPMAAEAARRRRGRAGRPVATWIWAPGAVVAMALTLAGHSAAAPVGLVVSAAATAVHGWRRRVRS